MERCSWFLCQHYYLRFQFCLQNIVWFAWLRQQRLHSLTKFHVHKSKSSLHCVFMKEVEQSLHNKTKNNQNIPACLRELNVIVVHLYSFLLYFELYLSCLYPSVELYFLLCFPNIDYMFVVFLPTQCMTTIIKKNIIIFHFLWTQTLTSWEETQINPISCVNTNKMWENENLTCWRFSVWGLLNLLIFIFLSSCSL